MAKRKKSSGTKMGRPEDPNAVRKQPPLGVRLPEEVSDALEEYVERTGRSKVSVVSDAIVQYLQRENRNKS